MKRANGEGSVTLDKATGRYVGRVTVGLDERGRPIRRKFHGKSRTEVVQRMDRARRALANGLPVPDDRLTVGTFLARWLNSLPGTVAESTEAAYATRVRLYLLPAIGHVGLTKLTPAHVADLLSDMDARGLSPSTRQYTRAVLRRALRRAEQEGLVDRNVAAIAEGPRSNRQEGRTMTPEEARRFLAAASTPILRDAATPGPKPNAAQRLNAAFVVSVGLGLRRGETLGLTWDAVELDEDPPVLRVRKQLLRRPNGLGLGLMDVKTMKSRRTVVLPTAVADALRTHRARQNAERLSAGAMWADQLGLVFTTPLGTPVDPRNFNDLVSDVAKRAGLGHWHPHELRHSAASILLAMDVPLEVVSEVLGHSSIRVTKDVYGHLLPGARAMAAEAMDRALSS